MGFSFWVGVGAVANALGVVLGAFGTHILKSRFSPQELLIYDTAVRYLFIHATALILLGLLIKHVPKPRCLIVAGWLFLAGIIIFCGSLFLLITTQIPALGAITPIGGLCFIVAWLVAAFSIIKN